jgi:hypothetical protein
MAWENPTWAEFEQVGKASDEAWAMIDQWEKADQ